MYFVVKQNICLPPTHIILSLLIPCCQLENVCFITLAPREGLTLCQIFAQNCQVAIKLSLISSSCIQHSANMIWSLPLREVIFSQAYMKFIYDPLSICYIIRLESLEEFLFKVRYHVCTVLQWKISQNLSYWHLGILLSGSLLSVITLFFGSFGMNICYSFEVSNFVIFKEI